MRFYGQLIVKVAKMFLKNYHVLNVMYFCNPPSFIQGILLMRNMNVGNTTNKVHEVDIINAPLGHTVFYV